MTALPGPGYFLRRPAHHLKILGLGITFADLEQPTGYDRGMAPNVQDYLGGLLVEEHRVPRALS